METALGPASRILVVDDEPLNRTLLKMILSADGYEVVEAESGAAALARLAAEPVDLVLLDMLMPEMSGLEVCRQIREELNRPTLPIIFVTAAHDRESRVQGKAAGGDDFLTKPVDQTELSVRVRNLLRLKRYHERQREMLEEAINDLRAQVLRLDRLASLGTLAAGAGHELVNITTVFLAVLTFVCQNAAEGRPPDAEDLDELKRVGDHLLTHGRALLRLGQPGVDRAERFELGELVIHTLAMLRATGRTKHIEVLTVNSLGHPIFVWMNRTRLEQILLNLVGNAADALEGITALPKRIRVLLEEDATGRVICTIEDTGAGIEEAKLQAIFEPYYTTKAPGRGTGFGLAVVRQIITSYGGRLSVESRVGEGTRFSFDLPPDRAMTAKGLEQ